MIGIPLSFLDDCGAGTECLIDFVQLLTEISTVAESFCTVKGLQNLLLFLGAEDRKLVDGETGKG